MKKYLMPLMLMSSMHSVLAQIIDIKLNCQISLTTNSSDGASEKVQISELVELYQNGGFLSIIPTSDKVSSVSTGATERGYKVFNFSDQNKWSLAKEKTDKRTQIIIDRNTGQMFYSEYFKFSDGIFWKTEGNGTCKKVDIEKKLF